MEENLLGHLLKANDPETAREVERHLADDPSVIHDLAMLRKAVAPLEAAREEFESPADLWLRTLSRVAEHVVATEGGVSSSEAGRTEELIRRAARVAMGAPAAPTIRPAPAASDAFNPAPRRRNVVGVLGLSAAVLALVMPAVFHARQQYQRTACQNGMRQFYQAAVTYSENNNGQFPQVEDGKPAATVATVLKEAGYLPEDVRFACPATGGNTAAPTTLVNYAYNLGFRDDATGELRAVDRRPDSNYMAILADAPIRQGGMALPGNHRRGHNVLFAAGHVQFCTTPDVGIDRDNIFFNAEGKVAAGKGPRDAVLGRPEEQP